MTNRLRDAREARGWTQVQLAKKSGVDQSNISKIERDGGEWVTWRTVEALATALDVKPAWLFPSSSDR